MSATYTFLPWLRRGFSDLVGSQNAAGSSRPELALRLSLNEGVVENAERFAGPGDVAGLAPEAVTRLYPARRVRDALPWRLAAVEFGEPDFPWRYTPAAPDGPGRLRPWLVLVVVEPGAGVVLEPATTGRHALLRVEGPAVDAQLPDLAESWAWAHLQVLGDEGASGDAALDVLLRDHPERLVARLLAPRRLEPASDYVAALVPAFEAGRRAGLGLDPLEGGDPGLAPAWQAGDAAVELPAYLHWSFHTGTSGDFETLVRRLRPRALRPGVGRLQLDASDPGPDALRDLAPEPLGFEGVLRPPLAADPARQPGDLGGPWEQANGGVDFPAELRAAIEDRGTAEEPRLAPPRYGLVAAGEPATPAADTDGWLRTVNLDPRARAAAALGTELVRELQETLVAEAWDQAAEARAERRAAARAELAELGRLSLLRRHLAPLAQATAAEMPLLRVAASARRTLMVPADGPGAEPVTLEQAAAAAGLAEGTLTATWRSLTRARGPIGRRAAAGAGALAQPLAGAPVTEATGEPLSLIHI